MEPYLPPVDRPRGLLIKVVYLFTRRMFGKVPTGTKVFTARMPTGFVSFLSKTYRLDNKLRLASETALLIRQQVASINTCSACMDASRWYALRASSDNAMACASCARSRGRKRRPSEVERDASQPVAVEFSGSRPSA